MKDFLKDYFRHFIIVQIVFIIYGVISATAAFIAWLIVKDGNSPFYRLVQIGVFIAVLPLIGALLNKGREEMKITKELLREKGACAVGYRDFLKESPEDKYPEGVEYQELLDCCAEKNYEYGVWLLEAFGSTDDVRKVDGDLITEKSIIFAGRLEVTGCIEAGCGIKAGEGIKAGWGIEAGEGIKAGWEFGIYAGLHVRVTSRNRKIIAKTKPENIMCGEFVEAKDD